LGLFWLVLCLVHGLICPQRLLHPYFKSESKHNVDGCNTLMIKSARYEPDQPAT
jgi:hypothetical protein